MANTLGVYNPIFYAQEALVQLEKALGMASRVYMGYDAERRAYGLGETINIKKPSTFSVSDAPATAQDITTETVAMSLDNWREVKFKLTDKELAFTGERIIQDHIRPAAYALANDIDVKLAALTLGIGNSQTTASSGEWAAADIVNKVRKPLFDMEAPVSDVGNFFLMIDGAAEADLLSLTAFSQQQGAGDLGINTQTRGSLGTKYGFDVFANQNVFDLSTAAAGTALSDTAAAVNGAKAKGSTSIAIDALGTGTIKRGAGIKFAGHRKVYAISSDVAIASNAATVTLSEGLEEAIADNEVATLFNQTAGAQCLGFHRNAFGLVMAPLSEMGNELGANIATVTDPVTGLSLRSRVYYVGNSSEVHVALDVLYGVKVLNSNLAVRVAES